MPQLPNWTERLHGNVIRYAVPLLFGDRPHRAQTSRLNSGSGVVLELGPGPFLLTAAHVLKPAQARLQESGTHMMAGRTEVRLSSQQVHIEEGLDVGTVRLTRAQLASLEAEGLQVVRPQDWPPPVPNVGDSIISVGFPKTWQAELSWDELDMASLLLSSTVDKVEPHRFALYLHPDYLVERKIDVGPEDRTITLPGLSGGPAFLCREAPILIPTLCGLVSEGANLGGGLVIIWYARLDRVGRDGSIAPLSSNNGAGRMSAPT